MDRDVVTGGFDLPLGPQVISQRGLRLPGPLGDPPPSFRPSALLRTRLQTSTGSSVLDTDGREVHVPLGRRMAEYRSVEERITARVEAMNHPLNDDEHAALLSDETVKGQSQAVTGFDLTFSAPKSVSILWALGGDDVRDELRAAHKAAWHDALGWIETEVAALRLGRAGVAQVDINGLSVAAFEHWYDRAGDPQLYTHVAVSAMVQTLDLASCR